MEYNNEKTIKRIRDLLFLAKSDAAILQEKWNENGVQLEASDDELKVMWRTLELIEGYAEDARILIGKMLDEREDMRMEAEEEDE